MHLKMNFMKIFCFKRSIPLFSALNVAFSRDHDLALLFILRSTSVKEIIHMATNRHSARFKLEVWTPMPKIKLKQKKGSTSSSAEKAKVTL